MILKNKKQSGNRKVAIIGSGCMLDTSRFVRSIADYVGLNIGVVNGYIVGEHGDAQVPVWSKVSIAGIPIEEYCANMNIAWNEEIKKDIKEQTKGMRPIITSVSSVLQGEHGAQDIALSVPSVVGPAGVQQRIKEKWSAEEDEGFMSAVEKVQKALKSIEE